MIEKQIIPLDKDIDDVILSIGRSQEHIVPILQAIHARFNYLPREVLKRISEITDISPASITSITSFYPQFRLKPAGRHLVQVCIGTACHVKGANKVYETLREHLHIADDKDTDDERLFTIKKVACLGCCTLAPVVQIDNIIYGHVLEQNSVAQIVTDFLKTSAESHEEPRDAGAVSLPGREDASIHVCLCSSCKACGSEHIFNAVKQHITRMHIPAAVKPVSCTGVSYKAPVLTINKPDGNTLHYGRVTKDDVPYILNTVLQPTSMMKKARAAFQVLMTRIYSDDEESPVIRYAHTVRDAVCDDFNQKQKQIVTEGAGSLNPLSLKEYRQNGGFEALRKALVTLTPDQIIECIAVSGLRGRGGGGFSTATKWSLVKREVSDIKYIICNGDEGDPGAFMDRMIMESFPFRVIEGIIITSIAVGANEGILYIRHEYPLAIERIERALAMCYDGNLLGKGILGSAHDFTLRIVKGAGAFICGEETALIASIEGKRGMPVKRPPYPAQRGYRDKPTLINNVETFAQVAWIITNGADHYQKLGTTSSKGTKVFALAGKIKKGGFIEVEMGMTIRDIVYTIGGGIPGDKALKAVQIGGPSGGCIPASLIDTPIDYESLKSTGAIMGSGGLVVLDEDDCMVDIARYFISFSRQESCGKCTFCRVGVKRLLDILDRIYYGKALKQDMDELMMLCHYVKRGSLCGLGKTSVNPVLTTLKYFRHEYEAHLQGKCLAHSCKHLITYTITDECIGCTKCAVQCPVNAISGVAYDKHSIADDLCIRCGGCYKTCPVQAIMVD